MQYLSRLPACLLILFLALNVSQAFQPRPPAAPAPVAVRIRVLPPPPLGLSPRTTTRQPTSLSAFKDNSADNDTTSQQQDALRVGSTVVASNSIPNLQIWQFQSYELTSIYDQGICSETGLIEKIPRLTLVDNANQQPGYTRYVTLYSSKYHDNNDSKAASAASATAGVIVEPNDVGLSSLQQEVTSSLLMALPLFGFWTALAYSFASQYSARTGGSFVDALLGR